MEQWKGKVAVVTGASAGIGASISKDLCLHGVIVVGLDQDLHPLQTLRNEIVELKKDSQFVPVQSDLNQEEDIKTAFEYIFVKLGCVDILVNNASMTQKTILLADDNLEQLKRVISTNISALVSCTKKAYHSMVAREVPGYIININRVPSKDGAPSMNIGPSTKHAITALNTVLRHELAFLKKDKIRVSNVSPAAVNSEGVQLPDDITLLIPEDVSATVLYILGTDLRVQVEDVTMYPTGAAV